MTILASTMIDRVKTAAVFAEVGDSGSFADRVVSDSIVAPSAYVALADEDAQAATVGNRHIVTATVAVLYLVQHIGQGETVGSYGLETVKAAARNVLIGWRPEGVTHPVQLDSGALLSALDSNILLWQDNFVFQYQL